jgi:hypothetical protein
MVQTCRTCSRVNPAEALYCYHDGNSLDGQGLTRRPLHSGAQPFHSPFVFPSGRACQNFDQLALACQERWTEAVQLLREGYLESFFSGLGRADLALTARAAAQSTNPDRGLDQLLDKLPSRALEPPRLRVIPDGINLGQLQIGQDHHLELRLVNEGMRLLEGSISCEDSFWVSLGPAPGQQWKLFEVRGELTIPVCVRGKQLRAAGRPLESLLVIESNGGDVIVRVRAEVPVTPFPEGVLAGATTPRQLAQKAKQAPKEAAVLFEKGAVVGWYQQNGWTYPVQGPPASGLGAVQQFFETLGLTRPPGVEISEGGVYFSGAAGERLEHALEVTTKENRPVYAHATCNQGWLQIGRPRLRGRTAVIPLVVPVVPDYPGALLRAEVLVTANGNQRFTVPVILAVGVDSCWPPTASEVIEEVIPVLPGAGDSRRQRSR